VKRRKVARRAAVNHAKEILRATGASRVSIWRWLNGVTVPHPRYQRALDRLAELNRASDIPPSSAGDE